MIGTNITFFAMLVLGYLGMPRRYATYEFDAAIAPLAQVTTWHQIASIGAAFILIGSLIFLWNLVQSWLEGPPVESADPWDLKPDDMLGREFAWFEQQRDSELATDGGTAKATADSSDPDHDL
jgi:cytochrome c oxidase subunit 1